MLSSMSQRRAPRAPPLPPGRSSWSRSWYLRSTVWCRQALPLERERKGRVGAGRQVPSPAQIRRSPERGRGRAALASRWPVGWSPESRPELRLELSEQVLAGRARLVWVQGDDQPAHRIHVLLCMQTVHPLDLFHLGSDGEGGTCWSRIGKADRGGLLMGPGLHARKACCNASSEPYLQLKGHGRRMPRRNPANGGRALSSTRPFI